MRGEPPPASRSMFGACGARARVLASLAYVMTLAAVRDFAPLAAGSALPLLMLMIGPRPRFLGRVLAEANKMAVFVWIFLPLTYPGAREFGFISREGVAAAFVLTWKINLMMAVMISLLDGLGISDISGALDRMRFPRKLCVLTLLTARYILLLSERMSDAWRSIRLRAPGIRGLAACRAFACMVAAALIHCSDRAARSSLAMERRGGEAGFFQGEGAAWSRSDTALCLICAANAAAVLAAAMLRG